MKNIIPTICICLLLAISLAAGVLSYYKLKTIPYGFHIDEMAGSVDIGCMATEGVDAHHVRLPLFSNLNYGTPKPPTFIYPGVVWSKFFGFSAPSIRAFSVTMHLIGILGIFFLAKSLFGWQYAILTVATASISPWTWSIGRVAFESLYAATFMIWGLYFFFKSNKTGWMALAGLFFAAAMYSYPPFRLQTPLMIPTLVIFSFWKAKRSLKAWLALTMTMSIALIPLVQKTLSGEIQHRFENISIFSKDYLHQLNSNGNWQDLAAIFARNYSLHLTPDFLFLTGDPSYVHSTRHFGILGWLDILALILGLTFLVLLFIKKEGNPIAQHYPLLVLFIVNIFIGIIPAALTNSELPNSLRITGSWPFMCLLSAFFLYHACQRSWWMWIVTVIVSLAFAFSFFRVYFKIFPQEGKGMFSYWTLDQANAAKTDQDWLNFMVTYRHDDYNTRYFLMQYRGISCNQSGTMWENMRDLLRAHGVD